MDFEDFSNMRKSKKMKTDTMTLALNNGQKWKLKSEGITKINELINKLDTFNSKIVEDYNLFGKEIFDIAKYFLLDPDYRDNELMQLKYFFHEAEPIIHSLIATNNLNEAQKLIIELKTQFTNFNNFFK